MVGDGAPPNAAFTIATAPSATCTNPATPKQLAGWAAEPDLWTHGYWGWDWADTFAKVGAVHINGTIQLSGNNLVAAGPHQHFSDDRAAKLSAGASSAYPVKPKARLMVVNALSELDAAGPPND